MRKGLVVARLGLFWGLERRSPDSGVNKANKFCKGSEQCFESTRAFSAKNELAKSRRFQKDDESPTAKM